ncbi:MAG TPA: MarR family transcriptional regulator [Chthoniobacterales bacterium]|nr:MarR family transcriptional regulator [Chthoniobacterales bacterium]
MPLQFIHPVQRATHRIGLHVDELRQPQLTQGEAHILALLAERSPLTLAELHRGLAHKRSTLTSILDRLAARGVITREVGKIDRRTFVVDLTKNGEKLARRVYRHLEKLEARVRRNVKARDIAAFTKVLAALESEATGPAASSSNQHSNGDRKGSVR